MGFDPKCLDDIDIHKTSGTNIFSESKSEMAGTAPGNAVKPVVKPRKPKKWVLIQNFFVKSEKEETALGNAALLPVVKLRKPKKIKKYLFW